MTLNDNRKNIYRFLARLYREELDMNIIEKMKKMDFPIDTEVRELNEGNKMLSEYIASADSERLTDLQVDFAKTFLGAGISQGGAAFPYESVYTSKKRIMMQEARDQVALLYRQKGLKKGDAYSKISEDHISLEMEYMACLCDSEITIEEQKKFFEEHLLNWVGDFCDDVENHSFTDFYKALSKITRGFLDMDRKIIKGLEGN